MLECVYHCTRYHCGTAVLVIIKHTREIPRPCYWLAFLIPVPPTESDPCYMLAHYIPIDSGAMLDIDMHDTPTHVDRSRDKR